MHIRLRRASGRRLVGRLWTLQLDRPRCPRLLRRVLGEQAALFQKTLSQLSPGLPHALCRELSRRLWAHLTQQLHRSRPAPQLGHKRRGQRQGSQHRPRPAQLLRV